MNDVVVELDMRSYEDCRKRIRSFDKVIRGAAMRGIKSSAVNVLADSQRNIKAHDSIATAQLINSGKTKSSMPGQYVDVIYNVIQAYYVEFGRKAGKFPPIDIIRQWVDKRGLSDIFSWKTRKRSRRGKAYENRANAAAFLIARKISRSGTSAKPFLHPALRSNETKTLSLVKQEIDKTIQSYGK